MPEGYKQKYKNNRRLFEIPPSPSNTKHPHKVYYPTNSKIQPSKNISLNPHKVYGFQWKACKSKLNKKKRNC